MKNEKDEGFTLIELLVVMIIIGILAAIAIPVFLSQKDKARQTAQKSDLIAIVTDVNSILVDGAAKSLTFSSVPGQYTISGFDANNLQVGTTGNLSPDDAVTNSSYSAGTFCIQVNNSKTNTSWKYDTRTGGASTPVAGTC